MMKRAVSVIAVAMLALALAGCAGSARVAVPGIDEAQGAVYNASQRVWLDSVEEAFSSAQEGDALYLYADAKSGALAAGAEGVSLDLQGFVLSIDAVGSGARGGQGLAHSGLAFGAGQCALSNGSVVVRMGAQPETAQSATTSYVGISAGEQGSLSLSGVDVEVTYVGTSMIAPEVELDGVAAGGTVEVKDGSDITVKAAEADDSFGASTVAGIRVHATSADASVILSDDSVIAIDNNAAQITQGAIGYPSTVLGTTKASNAELVEIAVDPSLEWYDDLQLRFLANAEFDSRADENGFVYGSEVYYAPSLTLANGLMVWAFSDPVNAGSAGRLDSVKPAHVFARSDYAVPLDAYGVWCADGFVGSVRQEGAISVTTGLGHAIGVYESSAGSYELDEGALTTACDQGAYRVSAGAFDLADFIDLNVQGDVVVAYPQQSDYTAVRQERASAWKTAVQGAETWQYVTEPLPFGELFSEWSAYGQAPAGDGEETTVGLSLVYYRMGQSGSYLYTAEESGTYEYAPDLDLISVANERIRPGDIVEIGGVENRFLGWSPRVSDVEPLYTDHIVVPDGNWGSFGAKLVLYGLYEIVEASVGEESAVHEPTSIEPVARASAEPLPAGGLETPSAQGQEAFSPLGGIAVLVGFAAALAGACLIWFAHGRKAAGRLVSSQAQSGQSSFQAAANAPGSDEQKRKGGLFF